MSQMRYIYLYIYTILYTLHYIINYIYSEVVSQMLRGCDPDQRFSRAYPSGAEVRKQAKLGRFYDWPSCTNVFTKRACHGSDGL